MQLISFTRANKAANTILINPEAVAAVTELDGKTVIFLRAPDVNAHGLQFKVNEDIETVANALTR